MIQHVESTATNRSRVEQVRKGQNVLACFHCGLPVITAGEFVDIQGNEPRQFCCAGCMAVASVISGAGLERYYRLRDAPGQKPDQQEQDEYVVFDNDLLQKTWVRKTGEDCQAQFLVDGISCAACVWLIENWLTRLPGIKSADINFSTNRLALEWDPRQIRVSEILQEIHKIGYQALPYTREARIELLDRQRSLLLKRLGVAAALGMQVMVISVALYAGDWFGMDPAIAGFLKKVNLLLVIPVLLYSARPFFQGAWRSLKTRSPGMDLSVSLGIGLAFLGSLWATIYQRGDVYYDSVVMFVFFLLAARYLELSSRIKGSRLMEPLASIVPATATRIVGIGDGASTRNVAVAELTRDDRVLVGLGQVVPADGIILNRQSRFDESLLTGESVPVPRKMGDQVLAGSINIEQPVTIRITSRPGDTVLSSILRLADLANISKPRITRLAERISGWFVLSIISVATLVAARGIWAGDSQWLPVTIAILVVTCPCALSLATPLALVAGANSLMHHGVYVVSSHALETLNRVNHFVFDKTGTLTLGEPDVDQVYPLASVDREQCLMIAASLEQGSSHPLGKSLLRAAQHLQLRFARDATFYPGCGLCASLDDTSPGDKSTGTASPDSESPATRTYCLGSIDFIRSRMNRLSWRSLERDFQRKVNDEEQPAIVLAGTDGPVAVITFTDKIRTGAGEFISYLKRQHIPSCLMSGDRDAPARSVADRLGIEEVHSSCKPKHKLCLLDQLIDQGKIVAMVGDGINDAPAMSKAHLAIALARNINLASANADMVLANSDLGVLIAARRVAQKTFAIIRQNIAWALLYNTCAIPAALLGYVPPWLAGIGMSLSSVIVVLNASRLSAVPDSGQADT